MGGDDLLSHNSRAVSSALRGLTSLFGMGRGGPPRYSHHVVSSMSSTWLRRRALSTNLSPTLASVLPLMYLIGNGKLSGY